MTTLLEGMALQKDTPMLGYYIAKPFLFYTDSLSQAIRAINPCSFT